MMQKMVDRHTSRCGPVVKEFLQVELDIAPLVSCRSGPGLGPSPLSISSPAAAAAPRPSSPNPSNITVAAAAGDCITTRGQGCVHFQWKLLRQKAEDVLWLASALFILFYGDFRSNFFSLLASDPRIPRAPLFYGMAFLLINCMVLLLFLLVYPQLKHSSEKKQEEYFTAAASTTFTLLGLASFVMLSIALWPVWYILTFPLLFTLFMALVVLVSYALPWSTLMDSDKDMSRSLSYNLNSLKV